MANRYRDKQFGTLQARDLPLSSLERLLEELTALLERLDGDPDAREWVLHRVTEIAMEPETRKSRIAEEMRAIEAAVHGGHLITVTGEPDPNTSTEGPPWIAFCFCGWKGTERATVDRTRTEAVAHMVESGAIRL